jgi:hypothetical protein
VVLNALEGELGFIKNQVKEGKLVLSVGWAFRPANEATVASFECGGTIGQEGAPVVVKGAVIAPVTPIDKMTTTSSLKFAASGGQQRQKSFEGGATNVLSVSLAGAAFEQAGLNSPDTVTGEEAAEIKAIP